MSVPSPPNVPAQDALCAEVIARHFDGAQIEGARVRTNLRGLIVDCHVPDLYSVGASRAAALYLRLSGGALGEESMFASLSGYGADDQEAIVTGACNWACVFGAVLRAALTGEPPSEAIALEAVLHSTRYRVVVDGLDRSLRDADAERPADIAETRQRLGGAPWLTPLVLAAETMPLLPAGRASILSVFVGDGPDQRIVEVKVNGADWPALNERFQAAPSAKTSGSCFLREFAVLVPQEKSQPLQRAALARTLLHARLPIPDSLRTLARWRGYEAHGGTLGTPATAEQVASLERDIGELPADYRGFLTDIQHAGAGPGYGFESPFHPFQRQLAHSPFSWVDSAGRAGLVQGALLLAHAGCGNAWLLALSGPERGTVWIDARGSDGGVRRVARSFDEWYRSWLDALVRNDRLFVRWDGFACAPAAVLSKLLRSLNDEGLDDAAARAAVPDRLGPGSIALVAGESPYSEALAALDPCQSCCELVRGFGLSDDVFARGAVPKVAPSQPRRGFFQRLFQRR